MTARVSPADLNVGDRIPGRGTVTQVTYLAANGLTGRHGGRWLIRTTEGDQPYQPASTVEVER